MAAPGPLDLPAGTTEVDAKTHLTNVVEPELALILQDSGVALGLQFRLTQAFRTVKRFAAYADDRAGVRTALRDDLALEANSLATRAAVASVVGAWEACRDYTQKETELKAEAKVMGIVRPVTQSAKAAMRAAFEATHGRLEELYEPSDDYLSTKT